jgi:methionine-rich copper-binding protein CopC
MIRVLALGGLVAAILLAGAGAIQATDRPTELVDASPGIDSVAVRPPAEIALNFRVPVEAVRVRLFKGDRLLSDSEARIQDSLAVASVETDGAGSYLVDWKGTTSSHDALAGAYVFVVDPRGSGSIAVDRDVAGAGGALGGLRVFAALVATTGAIALLAGAVQWAARQQQDSTKRRMVLGAWMAAIGGVVAAATYGVASDGSPGDLFDITVIPSTLASVPGRAWLAVALTTGLFPFLIVLARTVRGRVLSAVAVVVAVAVAAWVSVGLAWLLRVPWPLLAGAVAAAAVLWISIATGRPLGVIGGLAIGVVLAVPVIQTVQGSGTSAAVQTGDLLIEISLDPARPGINELHLYGFDVAGTGSTLGPTSVLAEHEEWAVGPLDIPVLRAGPNHFLSYHADLPLSGAWAFQVMTEIGEGQEEAVDMVLELP